jgi:glyoxylase-like metal-dependent hydrolase (beta-lactamase superfamily II)
MLLITSFTFNAFQENTYIIQNDDKKCWIIDPGMYEPSEINTLTAFISKNNLLPQAIINTHAHLDHIFGVQALIDAYNIPFGIHEKELPVLKAATTAGMLWGFPMDIIPQPTLFIKEGNPITMGEDQVEVRFVPGHSPGSILFYHAKGNWVIGGDVLFAGGIGRTDLPGGSYETLFNSIRTQVFTLPDKTTVHAGHGASTTVGYEKQYNPFLNP